MSSLDLYYKLHSNPELSYKEVETTKLIKNNLIQYPLDLHDVEPTGIIAVTKTNHEQTLVFRSDIDGLPITETTDASYQSTTSGVMHACGHDIHIASLLEFISTIDWQTLNYNLIFIFQPAEEVDGGAKLIINNSLFERHNIAGIYAVHVWPELEFGKLGIKSGVMMATNYVFKLTLVGNSTHCSTPAQGSEMLGFVANFNSYLNLIVAKKIDLNKGATINIGSIHGGQQANITLSELELVGTIRAKDDEVLSQIVKQITDYLKSTCNLHNLSFSFEQTECTYPCVENSDELMDKHNLTPTIVDSSFAVEDFGFYKQLGSTLFTFVGVGEQKPMSLHSSDFLPNPQIIKTISDYYQKILKDWNNA